MVEADVEGDSATSRPVIEVVLCHRASIAADRKRPRVSPYKGVCLPQFGHQLRQERLHLGPKTGTVWLKRNLLTQISAAGRITATSQDDLPGR